MNTLNTDDIFFRNLTISLLDLFNTTMTISLARQDQVEKFSVPFLYNYGTDEGFLKDFYIGLPNNCKIPIAEGTYDIIPRGIVTLNSFQVKTSDITNKFVRGQYTEQSKGQNDENLLTGYSAMLYALPLSVKFDVKVIVDNLNKAFKISEKILDLYYSNQVVYFQYNGLRVPAQFQFPTSETPTDGKKYQFTYADNNKMNVTMSIDVETYFPSFDSTTKLRAGNVMSNVNNFMQDGAGNYLRNQQTD